MMVIESIIMICFKSMLLAALLGKMVFVYSVIPLYFGTFVRICHYIRYSLQSDCATFQDFRIIMTKAFLSSQSMLIFLRLDKMIEWGWEEIFWIFWVWFAMTIGITFGLFLILFIRITTCITGQGPSGEVKGLFHILTILCNGLFTLTALILMVISDFNENKPLFSDPLLLYIPSVTTAGFALSLFLTLKYKQDIQSFYEKISQINQQDDSVNQSRLDQQLSSRQAKQKKRRLISIPLFPTFLQRVTSTYFKIGKEKTVPSQEADQAKIVDIDADSSSNHKRKKSRKLIATNVVQLDDLWSSSNIPNQAVTTRELEGKKLKSTEFLLTERVDNSQNNEGNSTPSIAKGMRTKRFENEPHPLENYIPSVTARMSRDKSVNACLICYEKNQDAVIMKCGHGGLCYDCALELWGKSDECFLCRERISQIVQISLDSRESEAVKVIACTEKIEVEE
eukprot:TRINITY_DN4720_c0_g1_i8.p1 TRINITY_DN4720_c0_g1~~TRINITY_DN4720_c0_g1_i8.p1  ORF type:complete len:452 (+),score=28.43 TRINITY_DN4720_c0_g1_i8:333-1688(+)